MLIWRVRSDVMTNAPVRYIVALATMLKATVDPSLFIYFEYANEVWNWGFEVAGYNLHAANASVLDDGDPHRFNYDGCNNPGCDGFCFDVVLDHFSRSFPAPCRLPRVPHTGSVWGAPEVTRAHLA